MKQSFARQGTPRLLHNRLGQTVLWFVIGFLLIGLSMLGVACSPSQPTAPPTVTTSSIASARSTTVATVVSSAAPSPSPTLTFAPRPPATAVSTLAPTAVPPTIVAGPTPPCVQPTLILGASKFRIESVARAADGSVAVPADAPEVAFWVQGTSANYVFALSPTSTNLGLKTKLKAGDPTKIVWGDCSTEEYVIKTIENGAPNMAKLLEPSAARVSVFVQSTGIAEGFVVQAGRPEPQVQATPAPTEEPAVDAELAFLETKASADGKTLTMSIAVKNTGKKAITLTTKTISLTAEGAAPIAPTSVEPVLPQELKPGASVNLRITFPKPAGNTAVFKLLDFSADIYF